MASSKRIRAVRTQCPSGTIWTVENALAQLKAVPAVRFDASCDVDLRLGVDPRKSDQSVRGSAMMPHGLGRVVRVFVLAQGPEADAARAAGADRVGFEDLVDHIKTQAAAGKWEFEVLVATPEAMPLVGQLARLLGPRGLMPSPKVGTVHAQPAVAVRQAKAGQAVFRADKSGFVRCSIGKLSFSVSALRENLRALIAEVQKAKPSTSKGVYLRGLHLSSTMGPGLPVDLTTLDSGG